jgi:hypothetical protein
LIEIGPNPALWIAVAVPVAVVGWSMLFAARAALDGPAWALRHLRVAAPLLAAGAVGGVAMTVVVRPFWSGLAVFYPFAVGWWMAASRRRQLALVEGDGGFGEIDPRLKFRLARGLGRSLRIAGAVAWFTGLGAAFLGVAQGWLIALLGPVAVVIAGIVGRRAVEPEI